MAVTQRKNKNFFILFLSIYLFLMPLDFYPIIEGVSVSKIMIFLPLLGAIFELPSFKRINGYSFLAVLYLFFVGITYFYSIDRSLTQSRLITLTLNIALIFIFSMRQYGYDEIEKLFNAVAFSGWLFLVLTLKYGKFNYGRLFIEIDGIHQDPNYFCGFFIFSICYYIWKYFSNNKVVNLIFAMILLIPVFLTGSRGGLISLFAAVVVLLWQYVRISKSNKISKLLLAILIITPLLIILWQFLPEEIKNRFSIEYTMDDGGAGRFEIWKECIEVFKDSYFDQKVFGHGSGTINVLLSGNKVAHNFYIESLLEVGVIGALAAFFMYFQYGKMALKLKEGFLVASYVGYMVMTLSMSLYSYKPIWNIILLIIIVTVYNKSENYNNKSVNNR